MTWEIARASGFVAYGLLAGSVILGLSVSSKLFGRTLSAKSLTFSHEGLAVGALLATITHLVALGMDHYVDFDLQALLLPGAASWQPQAVALGVVAMWMLAIVTVSFYIRSLIGQKTWRFIHYSSFGAFVAACAHGIMAGTDSGNPSALALYGATGGVVVALLIARVALAGESRPPTRPSVPA
jgi:predicted ferric reductase